MDQPRFSTCNYRIALKNSSNHIVYECHHPFPERNMARSQLDEKRTFHYYCINQSSHPNPHTMTENPCYIEIEIFRLFNLTPSGEVNKYALAAWHQKGVMFECLGKDMKMNPSIFQEFKIQLNYKNHGNCIKCNKPILSKSDLIVSRANGVEIWFHIKCYKYWELPHLLETWKILL